MSFDKFRERVNLFIYDSKESVLSILRILHLGVTLTALAVLLFYYGFEQTEKSTMYLWNVIEFSFAFYVIRYLIRIFYDFNPRQFFKDHRVESVIIFLLMIEGVAYNFTGGLLFPSLLAKLGVFGVKDTSTLFIQLFFFAYLIEEVVRRSSTIPIMRMHPAGIFISSFIIIILIGTGLLMLPEMTQAPGSMSFQDALFMSTSSTCVTGLSTIDVSADLTFKGQMVILILMKVGGLNIIAFGAFILLAAKLGLGIKHHEVIEDFVNRDSLLSTRTMLGKIFIWSIAFEAVGALCLFACWGDIPEIQNLGDRLFFSAFHSISAFNNAGMSLFSDGLAQASIETNYAVHLIIGLQVFAGALGMAALFDLLDPRKMRERMLHPWKHIEFSTKIALYFSLILVVIGTVGFYLLESGGTLEGKGSFGSWVTSLFQSISPRTAGFNTVDYGAMSTPMLILILFLMFVGSSSGSTGGGIKTSTFAILWATLVSTIRGKKNVELYKRTISGDLIMKAFTVMTFFVAGNMIAIFILTITEAEMMANGMDLMDIIFEEVSAFSTVGLSTGFTDSFSAEGKYTLIVCMIIGRVGTLTVGYLIGKKVISTRYKYPQGHTMVG